MILIIYVNPISQYIIDLGIRNPIQRNETFVCKSVHANRYITCRRRQSRVTTTCKSVSVCVCACGFFMFMFFCCFQTKLFDMESVALFVNCICVSVVDFGSFTLSECEFFSILLFQSGVLRILVLVMRKGLCLYK